ncbi:MAG: XRE family transcriptional regulator [Alphaproteobacteria bacterium]
MTSKTKGESLDVVRGRGNVFRDFDMPNPDLEQLRAILAARIIGVLDDKKMAVCKAQSLTGFAAADLSRIRNADIGRFTTDRLMTMLYRLGQEVKVSVKIHPRAGY